MANLIVEDRIVVDGAERTLTRRIRICGTCLLEWSSNQSNRDWRDEDVPERLHWNGDDRYCAGAYAGHYCDRHWREAGYRTDLPNVVGGMTEDEIEARDYRAEG